MTWFALAVCFGGFNDKTVAVRLASELGIDLAFDFAGTIP